MDTRTHTHVHIQTSWTKALEIMCWHMPDLKKLVHISVHGQHTPNISILVCMCICMTGLIAQTDNILFV